jgi:hypothetical protein
MDCMWRQDLQHGLSVKRSSNLNDYLCVGRIDAMNCPCRDDPCMANIHITDCPVSTVESFAICSVVERRICIMGCHCREDPSYNQFIKKGSELLAAHVRKIVGIDGL